MKHHGLTVGIVTVLALSMAVGCEFGPAAVDERQAPTLSLEASQETILVGESTMIFTETANLLGREVDIQWGASFGEITPARDGRVARFTSNVPGTAVITAEMTVNGQRLRDQVQVNVQTVE